MVSQKLFIVDKGLEVWVDLYSRQQSKEYILGKKGWIYQSQGHFSEKNQEKEITTVFGAVINNCLEQIGEIVGIDYSNFKQFAYMLGITDGENGYFGKHFDECYQEKLVRFNSGYGKEAVFFPTRKMMDKMYLKKLGPIIEPNPVLDALKTLKRR